MAKEIDIELIKKHIEYNSETGEFIWIKPLSNKHKCGDIAGTVNFKGYLVIQIKGQKYRAQRLAWVLHYGVDPKGYEIDHIDRDRLNNKITNLRLVTSSENNCNRTDSPTAIGIYKYKTKWRAQVGHRGKRIYIGSYDCPLIAHLAYVDKKRELRG